MNLQEECKQLVVDYYNKKVDVTDKKEITKNGKMFALKKKGEEE